MPLLCIGRCLKKRPKKIVEIGMSCGVATLSMLTALEEIGGDGEVISIDPFSTDTEKEIALLNVEKAGLSSRPHAYAECKSRGPFQSCSRKVLKSILLISTAGIASITCWSTFSMSTYFYALEAWWDLTTAVGQPSTASLKFVRSHRKYSECDVGLKRDFQGRNILYSFLRRVLRQSREDRYFLKEEHWMPPADYYQMF